MDNGIDVKIEGKKMIITIDMEAEPVISGSGKSIVLASTHGNQRTNAQYEGKPVTLGLNAYIKK